ncbi:MAG: F0F1 ATP synthase subunit B [Gemmatimonadota bacterium]|nr:F0F1 ATP synthase subunit B [Gemmatimonadota bacterium]
MRASRITAALIALSAAGPASLWAQGGGEGGGLYDINTGLSVWTLIVFGVLVFILGKYAWGPILRAVDAREKNIQSALDEAAARNAEASRLLAEHKEQLADARRQASELIAEGKAAGEGVRKEIEAKARSEALAIVERARVEIERERDAAIQMLRKESVELALAAASKLMQENLDQAKDRQLVERYLSEMGSNGGAKA